MGGGVEIQPSPVILPCLLLRTQLQHRSLFDVVVKAPCILWSGVMEWSLGVEAWSGVLEWIFGVEPWSEMLKRKRNINSGGKICLV